MLGQAHEGPFTNASPFSPNERRRHAMGDKGYLFGDELLREEDDESEELVGGKDSQKGKGTGKGKGARGATERIGLGELAGSGSGNDATGG